MSRRESETFYSDSDDAPEAVSISTSRSTAIDQIKKERSAVMEAKSKRKAGEDQRKAELEAKKAKIQAAMAQFISTTKNESKESVVEPVETSEDVSPKLIKFDSEDEEVEDEILPSGAKLVVLDKPQNKLDKEILKNRKRLARSKRQLQANPNIKRVPISEALKRPLLVSTDKSKTVKDEQPVKLYGSRKAYSLTAFPAII